MRILALLLTVLLCVPGCARPEHPLGADLRGRLAQPQPLSAEDLGRVLDEVSRTVEGKTVHFQQGSTGGTLEREQRSLVLGMLTDRAGLYDEGLRSDGGRTLRVLNAPGTSSNAEYEATRRLLIDLDTLQPVRFEFTDTAAIEENYAFDLTVQR